MLQTTRRELLLGAALSGLLPVTGGCGGGSSPLSGTSLRAAVWPEAEALFHSDPLWLGGDGVYSIDLGQGRVLWLFGDCFIATSSAHVRSAATIVHNTIAIQNGYDSATASIQFFWANSGSSPDAFFQNPDPTKWFWPHHGVRIGNMLLIFLSVVQSSSGGLGFTGVDWQAVVIDNPDADPNTWNIRYMQPTNQFAITVGVSVLVVGDALYAYSTPTGNPGPIYLARWPLAQASQGMLNNIEWYVGSRGWVSPADVSDAPTALMGNGQSEFNVYSNAPHTPYLEIQTNGFGGAVLSYRTAGALTGPWSGLQQFYVPPDVDLPNILIYAAKMHPALTGSGADLVVSYSANSTDFNTLVQDTSLYYPRFLKATWQP